MTFKFLGKTGLRNGVNLMCTGASSFFLVECSYVHCKESECSQFTPKVFWLYLGEKVLLKIA